MKLIKRITFGSAGLLVLMMMLATFLEKIQGTDTAWSVIYGSSVFTTIWVSWQYALFAYLIHRKLQRDFFTFLLHTAFLIILTGALTTRLCGKQGSIHLRMNDAPLRLSSLPDRIKSRSPSKCNCTISALIITKEALRRWTLPAAFGLMITERKRKEKCPWTGYSPTATIASTNRHTTKTDEVPPLPYLMTHGESASLTPDMPCSCFLS